MTTSLCPVSVNSTTHEAVSAANVSEALACPATPEDGRFIPHITPLKSEVLLPFDDIVLRPDRLGVMRRHGDSEHRDRRGALWVATAPPTPGRAIPLFKKVHPRRAGEAMLDMRCQGCNGDPDRNKQGMLFFVKPDTSRRHNQNWPDVEYTHHPPVCLPCTYEAMQVCKFVKEAPALRVRQARPWGIDCVAYKLGTDGDIQFDREVERCAYDDLKLLPWTVAIQPVARLSRCTVVDIRTELAAAGLEVPTAGPPPQLNVRTGTPNVRAGTRRRAMNGAVDG